MTPWMEPLLGAAVMAALFALFGVRAVLRGPETGADRCAGCTGEACALDGPCDARGDSLHTEREGTDWLDPPSGPYRERTAWETDHG